MMRDEVASETEIDKYQILAFISFTAEAGVPKYDFRAKSLDTALDLIIGLCHRPAYENTSYELSVSIGVLYWSNSGNTAKIEDHVRQCLDLTNWQIKGVDL